MTIVSPIVVAAFAMVLQAIPIHAQSPVENLNQVRSLAGPNPATVLIQNGDQLKLSAQQRDKLREVEERVDEMNADAVARPHERMASNRTTLPQQDLPEAMRREGDQRLHAVLTLRLMHVNNRRAGAEVLALLTAEQQVLARELLSAAWAEAQRSTRRN